ncbi:glycosyltransferase involved in cell wall biosynthesis [Pectinatus brassicae]|uniref:Glycosyltransferase involved in cell wall biosynthesis n=2 Tax=Pectinatus brassicae TaxID=862415 RepID=A0A840UXG6_9FIRM|nr:glycosyltransferase involved in cell wall biosynthesis [Pectinatus brassicae]
MITQYDISWRDDLFREEGFYSIAQCIEFKRNYYSVVVAGQKKSWVLCSDKQMVFTIEEKDKFLDEYSKDIYPLVSVLIPTYNRPKYFEIALKSVLMQTYRNIEIIIGDDSSNDDTQAIVKKYKKKYPNILYKKNNRRCSTVTERSYMNYSDVLHRSSGEYINYLNDDDVFEAEKIAKMMDYYLQYPNVSLVTSYRKLIDDNDRVIFDEKIMTLYPRWEVEKDTLLRGEIALKNLIMKINFIGEPTTALVRRCDIDNNFGTFSDKSFNCINDLPQWIQSLKKGDLIYIKEPLSSLRVHSKQKTKELFTQLFFKIDYFYIYLLSYKEKLISKNDFYSVMKFWQKIADISPEMLQSLKQESKDNRHNEEILNEFLALKDKVKYITNEIIE